VSTSHVLFHRVNSPLDVFRIVVAVYKGFGWSRDGNGYTWFDTIKVYIWAIKVYIWVRTLLMDSLLGKNLHSKVKRVLKRSTLTRTR
jgi:hypothetical protein